MYFKFETNFEELRLAMFGRHLSEKQTRTPEGAVIGESTSSCWLSYKYQLTAENN